MAQFTASNLTSGFIDLATYDELEKYMYGGLDATAYFVRQTRRATWFTQVPVALSRASGTPGFGQDWSVTISRAGDYLLYTWLRVTIPRAVALNTLSTFSNGASRATITLQNGQKANHVATLLSWTPNLMHNLIREAAITFNDLVAARFDSFQLDFWSAFTTPAGKQIGYANMIGQTTDLIEPSMELPAKTLNLPLPFFFSRDSGVALPTAALPYNDMRINFSFRNLNELLNAWDVYQDPGNADAYIYGPARPAVPNSDVGTVDLSSSCTVWANYAIVSNDERKRMACAPRDILIEQVQTAPIQSFNPQNSSSFDIRFSHAIKVLFFAVQNYTVGSYWSNYTTREALPCAGAASDHESLTLDGYFPGTDPIAETSLIYENTQRLANMGSDYFSLVEPYFAAPVIPNVCGYHMYSYSLDFICLDPLGSTNYGKLTNVSIIPAASQDAKCVSFAAPGEQTAAACYPNNWKRPQQFRFVVTAVNNNIIRISGGRNPSVPPTVGCQNSCGMTILGKQCNVPLISCF